MNAIFRCDASLLIGSGHVMRCRTLALELVRRGVQVTFLCRRQPGDLISYLQQDFLVVILQEQTLTPCEGLQDRELYAAWLGCSQATDAAQCIEALAEADITSCSWLVLDHYGLDHYWEEQLLTALSGTSPPPKLLVIDDLADRPHLADLLLDQNFFGEGTDQRYQNLVPQHCRQLLGPHYALLGPEYSQLHPLVPSRTWFRRLLVFFGGVDRPNLTGRAMEALLDPLLADLAVDVVLGLQSPHRQAVEELVACRPHTTLHDPLPSLAGLIARADLAIGAGGTTTWERICLKLPTLLVTVAANQLPATQALEQAGYLQFLGDAATVSAAQIRSALLDQVDAQFVGELSSTLADGWGRSRLVLAMMGLSGPIRLRFALSTDESLLLRWANDPQVRANSFSPQPITEAGHRQWFQRVLIDPNQLLLIAMAGDDCPIGQIRFLRKHEPASGHGSEATIGLSLDRCARGLGLSAVLVDEGLKVMEQSWGSTIEAVAEVFASNTASNFCFSRAGFVLDETPLFSPSGQTVNRWRRRRHVSPPISCNVSVR